MLFLLSARYMCNTHTTVETAWKKIPEGHVYAQHFPGTAVKSLQVGMAHFVVKQSFA